MSAQKKPHKKSPQKPYSRQTSLKSQTRSSTIATIFRSKPVIDGPFYSQAMKLWRIQYAERGLTYDASREQSLYMTSKDDVEVIRALLPQIQSWEEWKGFVASVRNTAMKGHLKGEVYVTGAGMYRDLRKAADD